MYRPVGAGRIPFTKKDQFFLVVLAHLLRYLIANPNTVVFPKKVIESEISTGTLRQYARQLFVANNLNANLPITDLLPLIEKATKELSEQNRPISFLSMSHHEIERTVEKINRILQFTIRPQGQTQTPGPPHRQLPRQLYPSLPAPPTSIQPATKEGVRSSRSPDEVPPGFFFLATLPLRAFSPIQWLLSGHLLRGGVGLFLDGPIGRRWRVHALTALLAYSIDPNQLQNVRTGGLDQGGIVQLTQVLTYYQEYLRASSSRSLRGKFFRWFWDPLIHPGHPNPILDRRHLVQDLAALHSETKGQQPEEDRQAVLLAFTQYLAMRMGRPGTDERWEPFYEMTGGLWRFRTQLGLWSWMRSGVSSMLIWARLQGPAAVLGGTAGSIAGGAVGVASGVQAGAALGSALGPVGSTIGGFFGGLLGGVGGSFIGVPLGGTLGWFGYQVFSSFRLFGGATSATVGSALNTVGNIALGGTAKAGAGRALSGIGTATSMAAGRLLSGLFTASMTNPWVVGGVVVGTIAIVSVVVIVNQLSIGGSFVPHQIGGGDTKLAANFGTVGDTGNCTLTKDAIMTIIPEETINVYITKRGLDKEKSAQIIKLASTNGVNAAILLGIWGKESTFSKNTKVGGDFGCGFPDVGKPSCKQPLNFSESLQCVLNLNTGGTCNLVNTLKSAQDFKVWMTSYTPTFYRPDGRPGYSNFFTVYNEIVNSITDESIKERVIPDCSGGIFIAAKYTGFPIDPGGNSAITQCFIGGAPSCSHNPINGVVQRGWNGLDIYAPKGTPVYTVLSGQIEEAWVGVMITSNGTKVPDYENLWVHFRGDDGKTFWYGHNQYILGTKNLSGLKGRRLAAGQQIASVGRFQTNTNNHLHLEVSQNGNFINPCNILECRLYKWSFGSCGNGCH